MSARWDRQRGSVPAKERSAPLVLMHDPNVVMMCALERRGDDAVCVAPRVDVSALHVYLQTTSLLNSEVHSALLRWRASRALWEATRYDVKIFVMCAEVLYAPPFRERYLAYFIPGHPLKPPHIPVPKYRGPLPLMMETYRAARAMCGSLPAYGCECRGPQFEVVLAACAGVRAGAGIDEVREVARSAVELARVFNVDGKPIRELVCAGIPEWAHPLADLKPLKGSL